MKNDSSLLRLRAANPFPEAVPVDAPDLFARITALPRDDRVRKPVRARRRRVVVVAVGLALMVVLASTAFAISNWVLGDAVRPPVTRSEYRTPSTS